jgi:O-antigen/teichoic acid export membrane protein
MSEVVDASLKKAAKGAAFVLFGTSTGIFIWFFTKVIIIRGLSKEDLGLYSLALAVVSVASLLASLGLANGVPRFISIFLGKGKDKEAEKVSRHALGISLATGILWFVALVSLSSFVSERIFYKPEFASPLRAFSAFIPLGVLSVALIAILRGYGIIKTRVYSDLGHPLLFLVLLALAYTFIGISLTGVIYSYILSILFVVVFLSVYAKKRIGIHPLSISGGAHGMELLRFSIPLLAQGVMGLVLNWTDTLMLGRYTTAEEVGVYNVGISAARLLTFSLGAIDFVLMPIAGHLYSQRQMGELKRIYQVSTKWIFYATLPAFFIFLFFPGMALSFVFGQRFVEAAPSLRILSVGFMFNTLMGTNTTLLMVFGLSRQIMRISVLTTTLNIALNYVFIKIIGMGIEGAALATMISFIAMNLMYSSILYKESGIQPFTMQYLKPVFFTGIIGLLIYGMAKTLPLSLWMLPLYFLLFVLGYAASILLTRSIEKEDIFLLDEISKKIGIELGYLKKLFVRFAHE